MLSMETRYACLGELEVKRWLFFLGFINICKISFLVSVGGVKNAKNAKSNISMMIQGYCQKT